MPKLSWDPHKIWKRVDRTSRDLGHMNALIEEELRLSEAARLRGRCSWPDAARVSSAFGAWDQIMGIARIGRGDAAGWEQIDWEYQHQRLIRLDDVRGVRTGGTLGLDAQFKGFLFHAITKGDTEYIDSLLSVLTEAAESRGGSLPVAANPFGYSSGCFSLWLAAAWRGVDCPWAEVVQGWNLGMYAGFTESADNLDRFMRNLEGCCEAHCLGYTVPKPVPEWGYLPYCLIPIEIAAILRWRRDANLPAQTPEHPLMGTMFADLEGLTRNYAPSTRLQQTWELFKIAN